jgi:hypothetical protein
LHPAELIDRLALLIEMPKDLRPDKRLNKYIKINEILDWAEGNTGGFEKLATQLKKLAGKK